MTKQEVRGIIKSGKFKSEKHKKLLVDMEFFAEMYELSDSLLNERWDITKLEMLHQMIGDLVDEKVEQLGL